MPLELQIIRASEFIRLGAHGKLDLESSREDLRKLAAACRRRGIDRALVDLRDLHHGSKPMLSPTDLASLVKTFQEIGFTREQRLALLYTADPHHGARLFALISTLSGWSVQAFSVFEEAVTWLSSEGPCEPAPAAEPIPLVRAGRTRIHTQRHSPRSR